MTHEELIASIPTNGVECLYLSKKYTAVYKRNKAVVLIGEGESSWVDDKDIYPLPERRPMTDREMFGLFAKGAEVRGISYKETYRSWKVGDLGDTEEYRLSNSTEWLPCTVEVME